MFAAIVSALVFVVPRVDVPHKPCGVCAVRARVKMRASVLVQMQRQAAGRGRAQAVFSWVLHTAPHQTRASSLSLPQPRALSVGTLAMLHAFAQFAAQTITINQKHISKHE